MSQEDVEMVTLRTGEEVPRTLVEAILIPLTALYDNPRCPMALYELVMCCRDSTHIPFGKPTKEILKELELIVSIEPGHVEIHTDVRHIVLAATMENEGRVELVSPYSR